MHMEGENSMKYIAEFTNGKNYVRAYNEEKKRSTQSRQVYIPV